MGDVLYVHTAIFSPKVVVLEFSCRDSNAWRMGRGVCMHNPHAMQELSTSL